MSEALLAIQNILQNSIIFDRSRETVLFTPFGDKKVTQFTNARDNEIIDLIYDHASLIPCCFTHW